MRLQVGALRPLSNANIVIKQCSGKKSPSLSYFAAAKKTIEPKFSYENWSVMSEKMKVCDLA